MNRNQSPLDIRALYPEEWLAGLNLVFSHLDPPVQNLQTETALVAARDEPNSLDGLLGCFNENKLVGAILATIHSGKYALLTKPAVVSNSKAGFLQDSVPLERLLVQKCSDWAISKHAKILQCMLELNDQSCRHFEAAGYQSLTEIQYLARELGSIAVDEPDFLDPEPLGFEGKSLRLTSLDPNEHRDRWIQILCETYEDTLDCPFLCGRRAMPDVLDGYINTGQYSDENWFLFSLQGTQESVPKDIACLILADHPQNEQVELVYFGITKNARGNALGDSIVRFALTRAKKQNARRLVLAVDAANSPAKRIYDRLGFHIWDQRSAVLKFVD